MAALWVGYFWRPDRTCITRKGTKPHTTQRRQVDSEKGKASQERLMVWRGPLANISNDSVIYFPQNYVSLPPKPHYLCWHQTQFNASTLPLGPALWRALAATCPLSQPACCPPYPRGQVPGFRQPHPAPGSPRRAQVQPNGSPQTYGLHSLCLHLGNKTQKARKLKWFILSFPVLL